MFRYYPKISYKIDDYYSVDLVDITTRIKIAEYIKDTSLVNVRDYVIQNGAKPEIVSYNLYGKPTYAYILLLINKIHNLYDEWPRDYTTFRKFIIEKYGSISNSNVVAYWFNGDGVQIQESVWDDLVDAKKYTKTHFEYESDLNDKKSRIKIVNASLIPKFENAIQEILNSTENV